ncbi:MAG: ATP synthase subunit I [Oscillospiraceae bacterium]|nr:ATP synthase subunit I [Oscillospiraceae bacterium]
MAKRKIDESFGKVTKVNMILTAVENIGFLVFGHWDYTVLLGSLWGLGMTTLFFYMICVSVPRALSTDDPDIATKRLRNSQMERTAMLAVGIFIALKVPHINWPAALIPLLFTRISITLLHLDREEE